MNDTERERGIPSILREHPERDDDARFRLIGHRDVLDADARCRLR